MSLIPTAEAPGTLGLAQAQATLKNDSQMLAALGLSASLWPGNSQSRRLSDLGNVGCSLAAAVHFLLRRPKSDRLPGWFAATGRRWR